MNAIEKITSTKKIIRIKNDEGETIKSKQVTVWNATIANLSLMALGSSAPEILLAVIETITGLAMDACPGKLGASTIVGSGAFNLLVISGVSILAVSEKNDTDPERDETVPLGVKKINDMYVFSVTATLSIFAYVWLLVCLTDQVVEIWEGVLTFCFFPLLLGLAFGADRYNASRTKGEEDAGEGDPLAEGNDLVIEFSALEIYRELIKEKQGEKPVDEEHRAKRDKMRQFIKDTMKTDQIDRVDLEKLKHEIEGDGLLTRLKYRKQV